MKPPSHPQPNLPQQGEGVSEAVAPKVQPNQVLLPNFLGSRLKYGENHAKKGSLHTSAQDVANATSQTLEENRFQDQPHRRRWNAGAGVVGSTCKGSL